MTAETAISIGGALSVTFGWILFDHVFQLRRRVSALEDDGWSSQIMTWSEFTALAGTPLRGVPYWELGGEGPDRKVMVWTHVMIGRPSLDDVVPK